MLQSASSAKYLSSIGIIILLTLISCATTHQFNHSDYLNPYEEEFDLELNNFSKAKMIQTINFRGTMSASDLNEGVNGRVVLHLFVDETGLVRHVDIKRRVHPSIDNPLRDRVLGQQIEPAYLEGDPVKSVLELSFNFQSRARDLRGIRRYR